MRGHNHVCGRVLTSGQAVMSLQAPQFRARLWLGTGLRGPGIIRVVALLPTLVLLLLPLLLLSWQLPPVVAACGWPEG